MQRLASDEQARMQAAFDRGTDFPEIKPEERAYLLD